MLWLILFSIAVVLIYLKVSKLHNHWTERGVKQRKQVYLLGDQAAVMFKRQSFFQLFLDLYNAFPNERYVGVYQTTVPTLMITDLELLKQITVKKFEHFVNHRPSTNFDDRIWTENLFLLQGDEWKTMRSIVSPIFTSSKRASSSI